MVEYVITYKFLPAKYNYIPLCYTAKKKGVALMKEKFKAYLISQGYSEITPSGKPSTVYDYVKRIDRVCEWEQLDWEMLKGKIDSIVPQYDCGGAKEQLGKISHSAVINALRRFQECVHRN